MKVILFMNELNLFDHGDVFNLDDSGGGGNLFTDWIYII